MGIVRIGPAGWSYKDWEGVVYPDSSSRKFDQLGYIASLFDTVEVNSAFYRIPPPAHSKSWTRRVAHNPDFQFTTKLFRGFTHEKEVSASDVDAFRAYLDPFVEGDRLGGVLIQFPWSFKEYSDARGKLEGLFESFSEYPLVVEVRHGSFQHAAFYDFLRAHDVGFVNIDQPLFGDSVKPSEIVTSDVSYVRFHGRNYQKWFAHGESWERYNYTYSKDELAPWIGRIARMSEKSDVYTVTNNHFRGQAVVNAIEVKQALGQPVEVPPQLAAAYPDHFV